MLLTTRLRDEIDRVFGSRQTIKQEDLAELQYTSCVIKETLRLWPVAPGLNRVSAGDFEINSMKIPPNSWVQVEREGTKTLKLNNLSHALIQ